MATASPHSKIINALARARLRPLGLQQKGRSRFWCDDCGWHGIAVEFQASSFSKMSYLNVGMSWFWYPCEYWSYDLGYREPDSADFHDEAQFQRDFGRLVDKAIEAIHRYRNSCATLADAYKNALEEHGQLRPGGRPDVHLGLLAGLNGEAEQARGRLSFVAAQESRTEADAAQRAFCEKAMDRLDNVSALRSWVEENVAACRQLRGLPSLDGPALPTH